MPVMLYTPRYFLNYQLLQKPFGLIICSRQKVLCVHKLINQCISLNHHRLNMLHSLRYLILRIFREVYVKLILRLQNLIKHLHILSINSIDKAHIFSHLYSDLFRQHRHDGEVHQKNKSYFDLEFNENEQKKVKSKQNKELYDY